MLDEFFHDVFDHIFGGIKAKVIYTHGYWVDIFTDITREVELEKKIRDKYIFEDIITQDRG
jgi:hypothetical protein